MLLADTQKCRKQLPAPNKSVLLGAHITHPDLLLSGAKSSCAGHSQAEAYLPVAADGFGIVGTIVGANS